MEGKNAGLASQGSPSTLRKNRRLATSEIAGLEESRHEREGEGAHLHACGNRGAAQTRFATLVSPRWLDTPKISDEQLERHADGHQYGWPPCRSGVASP